ncbi:J protein [Citrobacter sp. wls621]|nr:J protein [Citrobacter sp. wls621]
MTARAFSRVLDMPAGSGNVTLSFTVSSRGYGGGASASVSNLLVIVVKKNSTGISIY